MTFGSRRGTGSNAYEETALDSSAFAINEQWRICFRWEAGHAYEVEIVDYHA